MLSAAALVTFAVSVRRPRRNPSNSSGGSPIDFVMLNALRETAAADAAIAQASAVLRAALAPYAH
jgi:hypothetical protein